MIVVVVVVVMLLLLILGVRRLLVSEDQKNMCVCGVGGGLVSLRAGSFLGGGQERENIRGKRGGAPGGGSRTLAYRQRQNQT